MGMCSLDVDRHSHKDVRQEYAVVTISRLLQIIGLFCRISSLLQGSFAKKTLTFKEPTNRRQPIVGRRTSRSRVVGVWS